MCFGHTCFKLQKSVKVHIWYFPSHYNIKKRTLKESQSEQDLMATNPTQKLCPGKHRKNRGSEMHHDILLYVFTESRVNDLFESTSFLITGVKSEKSNVLIFISPKQNKYIKIRTISHTTYTHITACSWTLGWRMKLPFPSSGVSNDHRSVRIIPIARIEKNSFTYWTFRSVLYEPKVESF
jgi:hypothetical protein